MNQREHGLTLLEVLVSLSLLSIALAALMPAFLVNLNLNSKSEARTQAVTIAQQVLDGYRLRDPSSSDIPTSGSEQGSLTDQDGITWPYTVTFCATPSYCGSGSRHIRVEVKRNGTSIYTAETVYTQLFYETEGTN